MSGNGAGPFCGKNTSKHVLGPAIPCLLIGVVAIAFLGSASGRVSAAELTVLRDYHHKSQRKHVQRVAYHVECRIGWWQFYWDGIPYPRWGTRCI